MTTAEPIELSVALDRAAGRRYPLGQQLVDELRRRVQAGSLGPGERLPPVRGLAARLNVTPETVAGAYKRLVEEGYLRGEIGRGTFVAAPPLHAEEDPLAPFEAAGALPPFASQQPTPGPPANRDLLRLASQPGLVSFAASVAALDLAPVEPLRRALSDVLAKDGAKALQVGAAQGYQPLRAAIHDLPIVEDDSAGFIHLDGDGLAPPSLKAEDHAGYVLHLGTFSKLIAAGLRLGWLVADPPVLEKLVAAKYASDLSSDALVQRAVQRLLDDGTLAAHLVGARRAYTGRRRGLVD